MSVEHFVKLKTESIGQLIEYMDKRLYPACENEIRHCFNDRGGEYHTFVNDRISAFLHTENERDIQMEREECGADINCCVSFQLFSDTDCNSEDNILFFVKGILRDFGCDLLLLPNGEPYAVTRCGDEGKITLYGDFFDGWFGEKRRKDFEEFIRQL